MPALPKSPALRGKGRVGAKASAKTRYQQQTALVRQPVVALPTQKESHKKTSHCVGDKGGPRKVHLPRAKQQPDGVAAKAAQTSA